MSELIDLLITSVVYGLAPVIISLFLSIIIYIIIHKFLFSSISDNTQDRNLRVAGYIFVAAFASLGGAMGLFMGASRESAVEFVIPGLLTFISGFGAYLFSRDATGALREHIPAAILFLILSAVFCATFGAGMRGKQELAKRDYEEWLTHYEKVVLPFELEIGRHNLKKGE